MPFISESLNQANQLQNALDAGLASISRDQAVEFTQYKKTILPADGFVYWVQTGVLTTVTGSIHYAIDKRQNEDETIAINSIVFTAEQQIQVFDTVSPDVIFIGTFAGQSFAFSRQGEYYQQANLWHYTGDAIYPALASQIISSAAGLAALSPIVSNSLPIWLSQNAYAPVYPSFLVPDNIQPPYIVAHIEPDDTTAVQGFPLYDMVITGTPGGIGFFEIGKSAIGENNLNYGTPVPIGAGIGQFVIGQSTIGPADTGFYYQPSNQLMQDRVTLTLYGFNNQLAIQYFNALMQYSLNTDAFGFMNSPAIRDDKRTQRELGIIAQKKHIQIDASYYQSTTAAIAQRLIAAAACNYVT